MTNLSQHCTSLDLSKRLKAAGVEQKSLFYWKISTGELCFEITTQSMDDWASAFLASEIGAMLPASLENGRSLTISKQSLPARKITWFVQYLTVDWNEHRHIQRDVAFSKMADTLPDALGEMLLWLIGQGLVKVSEIR